MMLMLMRQAGDVSERIKLKANGFGTAKFYVNSDESSTNLMADERK